MPACCGKCSIGYATCWTLRVLQWKLYEWEALTARLMIASGLSFRSVMLSVDSCVVVSRPDDCVSAKIGLQ